ncbi:NUDIX hydrolase [Luteimonas sp. SJ-92]|uniref:NUDIX hydrolase n=1 Tax=Luteimonas salinisoli TaxID=2752307 RepID=A0A853JBI2_9GAMM|nr:NUDIX hydrolase [Luteimonas salinisoli]NZA26017.1 NUDIX hydrolase [Luteimonas salinisoli]
MISASPLPPLAASFADYAARWPGEAACAELFIALVGDPQDPFVRARLDGHFTASSLVLSGDGRRTLLTHHRKLGLWLQPGGHADGDRDLARVALREAEEETGLRGLRLEGGILDLDRHRIPEHRGVPEHWHYDVRYVVRAGADERFLVSDESHALAWRALDEVADDPALDPTLRRMARKWLGLGGTTAAATTPAA